MNQSRQIRGTGNARALASATITALVLSGCTGHLFSGIDYPDRSRPVVRIETLSGIEYGAATQQGILFLGRTAQRGPCRVHYFLGPTPVVEDGEIEHAGGVYYRAGIDLKHQSVNLLNRAVTKSDNLIAMLWAGLDVVRLPVTLAQGEGIEGDLLEDPGQRLPVGTALFTYDDYNDLYFFVGLIAAEVTLEHENGTAQKFLSFTGIDRLHELYLTQKPYTPPKKVKHRPDDISVYK